MSFCARICDALELGTARLTLLGTTYPCLLDGFLSRFKLEVVESVLHIGDHLVALLNLTITAEGEPRSSLA